MGNCQAAEAAAVVIQHPGGKVERLYGGAATAGEVMRSNPGHYVALVVLRVSGKADAARITKVKLLKPKDALLLGQVYRLVTSQEVAKAIQARRQDRARRYCGEAVEDHDDDDDHRRRQRPGHNNNDSKIAFIQEQQRRRAERQHRRGSVGGGGGGGGGRARLWQPSLQSISESAS